MRSIIVFFVILIQISCGSNKGTNQENWSHHDLKTRQYLIEGRRLYTIHCANCHMEDGKGLAKLIPPLAQSDFMLSDASRTICIIKYGMTGEITVNDHTYNHPMPGLGHLSEIEIAEITTYIYNSWGHDKGIVSIPEVREALKNCKDQD